MKSGTMSRKFLGIMSLVACGVLAMVLLVGCGGSNNSSSSSSNESKQEAAEPAAAAPADNKLIVGLDNAYPPYGFVGDDGELTGFDIDLAKEVAARNGWDIQLEAIDWDAKDVMLEQGTINCIWNGFTMEGRESDYTFTEPYMLNEQVIVVKADSGINGDADLAGKNVITQMDSAALDVLQGDMADVAATFAGGAPQTIGDYNQAFMQLESGAVDAVACDLSIAQYQMAAKPNVFKQLERPLSSEHYAVGFKLGEQDLADVVTNTLYEMYQDGTVAQICEKYAEYGVSMENWVLDHAAGEAASEGASGSSK